MFMMIGKLRVVDARAFVKWDDGKLEFTDTADYLKRYVLDEFKLRDGRLIGPVCGPYTERNHQKSALSSYMILSEIFEPSAMLAGDKPMPPSIPFDAIP